MPTSVTLNVTNGKNSDTRPFTINVQNKKFINSIITVGENNTITSEQMKQLQDTAARCGDFGVLENCDLSQQERINLANLNGYDKFYEIKLSDDGKFWEVKVKKTSALTPNPTLGNIREDFGIRKNVLVKYDDNGHYEFPENEFLKNKKMPSYENNRDYDQLKLEEDDVIKLPVNEIEINENPRNFLQRLMN